MPRPIIDDVGTDVQNRELLEPALAGERIAALDVTEQDVVGSVRWIGLSASPDVCSLGTSGAGNQDPTQ